MTHVRPLLESGVGLSPFGKDVVRKMNELGMLVDVSHISDMSFYDALDTSCKPVVATIHAADPWQTILATLPMPRIESGRGWRCGPG